MRSTTSLILATALMQAAPAQPPSQQPPVTFKVEVNYVEIDANVEDEQGKFVRNLTRDDFQIVEDGKPQALTAFAMVDIPIVRADPPLNSNRMIPTAAESTPTPFKNPEFSL